MGGYLHASQGPDVARDLHDVLDLEFLDEATIAVVAADAHECAEALVDPYENGLVSTRCSGRFVEADFVTCLAIDVFLTFEFRVGPVEEAECQIFISEVCAGDGFDELFARELHLAAIDHAEELKLFVAEAHVEDVPVRAVFGVLELDVLPFEEKRDGCAFTAANEGAFERAVELCEGCCDPRAFDNGTRVGGVCECGYGDRQKSGECGEKGGSHMRMVMVHVDLDKRSFCFLQMIFCCLDWFSTWVSVLASVNGVMTIFESASRLEWGSLDLPMMGIARDWDGEELEPVPAFALACDLEFLWFIAHHRAPAICCGLAPPGAFAAELWKYDVAEFFISDPESGRYIEFNLAPNSAWWSCEFSSPRQRAVMADVAMPGVRTWADGLMAGGWLAAMAVPLDVLRARVGFGARSRANVSMILGSAPRRFLTASPLGVGEPDFHRPDFFPEVVLTPLCEIGWGVRESVD